MQRFVEFEVGGFYHTYNRGVDKRAIFLDAADFRRFVRLLYTCNSTQTIRFQRTKDKPLSDISREEPLVDIGAWALLANHFHVLASERIEGGISKFFEKLLTSYALYFNKRYERSGRLFQNNFQAKSANEDRYLKYLFVYLHINPLDLYTSGWRESGVDTKAAHRFLMEYPYSSYPDYAGVERDEGLIVNPDAFPGYFETPDEFKAFITEWVSAPDGLDLTEDN